jgi:para-aminobenzoate synthetase component I
MKELFLSDKLNTHNLFYRLHETYDVFCFMSSNNVAASDFFSGNNKGFEVLIAAGKISEISVDNNCEKELTSFLKKHENDWKFGYVSYDYKNELENLKSEKPDLIKFPLVHFFVPKHVFALKNNSLVLLKGTETDSEVIKLTETKEKPFYSASKTNNIPIKINASISKNEYLKKVNSLLRHIKAGDIYEINFCQEFFSQNICLNPAELYTSLSTVSPAPFSVFYKSNNKYLISASPERFVKKIDSKIISQPIKGTKRRSADLKEDEQIKTALFESRKERSENVMVVDMVRNDLSKIAKKGTVKVEELYGIYSFRQVHQMISTISADVEKDILFTDVLRALFPMGSMTGAPKVKAMELIEQYENTKRGLFSGTVGYITPENDFDFNVVIRSVLYNENEENLSFSVGSAITSLSDPEEEYNECLIKAEAIFQVLQNTTLR